MHLFATANIKEMESLVFLSFRVTFFILYIFSSIAYQTELIQQFLCLHVFVEFAEWSASCAECLSAQVPFVCLSASAPKYHEYPSAQVPFKCPSASSAQVTKCLKFPSTRVPKCLWSAFWVSNFPLSTI